MFYNNCSTEPNLYGRRDRSILEMLDRWYKDRVISVEMLAAVRELREKYCNLPSIDDMEGP